MRSIELFSGCGGLAIGLSRAGFKSSCMVELDSHSIANVRHNCDRRILHVCDWPVHQRDVRTFDWSQYRDIDVVAGGPPCQPFSVGGLHKGHQDQRDMWPEAVRSVRELKPSGFLFENVRGLTRAAFSDYLAWIVQSLTRPSVEQKTGENCETHLNRLSGSIAEEEYVVHVHKLNAADFGAAQKRHRVMIVGVRSSFARSVSSIDLTHSRDRLLWDQWISGEYWRKHRLDRPENGPDKVDVSSVNRLQILNEPPAEKPWVTVRDALMGLGEPGNNNIPNHVLQRGARSYPGHTGSPLDKPAKALKAGVHGVPGGENTMAFDDGSVRYFTVREAARLQGIPDGFEFIGSWSENMRQLGNAVPTQLSEAVARKLFQTLQSTKNKLKEVAA